MVHRSPGALRVFGRAADDVHDRHVLGVTARDRIGRRKFTYAECRYDGGHSAQSPVPVGRVTGVELVGAAYPPDGGMCDDVVQKCEVVVAGDAEDLGDSEFGEAVQQVVADGVIGISGPGDAISHKHDGTRGPNCSGRHAVSPIVRAMAIKESRDIVIEASPEEILDVIADFEAMPEWSDPHQSAEVLETGDDGRPSKVKMKVRTAGITDEQVVAYTWSGNEVTWTLVSSGQQKSQDGKYTLVPQDDGTLVKMQ